MKNNFIQYKDIFDGQDDIPEKLYTKKIEVNPYIMEDIITIFKIKEIQNEMDSVLEIKKNRLEKLEQELNYSYDSMGRRDDENNLSQLKNAWENGKWKEEVSLVREEDKINILRYFAQRGLIIDKLKFIGEHDLPLTCLWVVIWWVDLGYDEEDDDECPCVFIHPEFILNSAWHIQPPEDDTSWEINIDEIKEIIVDNTKYTFLL